MSEEEIEIIKRGAIENAKLAECFSIDTAQAMENLGRGCEMVMRIAFIEGAKLGYQLRHERSQV